MDVRVRGRWGRWKGGEDVEVKKNISTITFKM